MTSFDHIQQGIDRLSSLIDSSELNVTEQFVLNCPPGTDSFAALISPSATPFLEAMARRSQQSTWERFGRVMRIYAPLYVSNVCINECVYCGFNRKNSYKRVTLDVEAAKKEAEVIFEKGFRHLLLVSGEAPEVVSPEYLCEIAAALHEHLPSLSVEVSPFSEEDYRKLVEGGIEGLAVYQETYDQELYAKVHPAGPKSDYMWRLETPERGAAAGMRHVSLGVLIGLNENWREDCLATALHVEYMLKHFWRTKYSVSLPRLCECEGGYQPGTVVTDKDLAQLIFAYRIAFPDVGVNLSTREAPALRDGLMPLGVTHISAESSTEPGGYVSPSEAKESDGKQFVIDDNRTAAEMSEVLKGMGLEPVWKDWDASIL